MNLMTFLALAPQPGGGAGGEGGSPLLLPGYIVLMIAVFYLLMIRPQQKKAKERQRLLESIKTGDRVVFSGGILGVISNVKDKTLMVKIADGVKIEVARGGITQILDKGEAPEDEQK